MLLDTDSFWALLEGSRRHGCGGDTRDAWLRDTLAARSGCDIIGFQACLDALTDQALTWDLWAAADRIFGGWCPDDAFRSFQHWMMGLGRAVFEAAVSDPDVLGYAPEVVRLSGCPRGGWTAADRPGWPTLDTIGLQAYELATGPSGDFGDAFYAAVHVARRAAVPSPRHPCAAPTAGHRDPTGRRWSASDEAEAARRLPRLSVLFPLEEPYAGGPAPARPGGPRAGQADVPGAAPGGAERPGTPGPQPPLTSRM
jgi:hypothetical protein